MKFAPLYETGTIPHKVALGTRSDRGTRLYLRWRQFGNWKWEALEGLTSTSPAAIKAGELAAQRQCARLLIGEPAAAPVAAPLIAITTGLALAINAETGKYPVKSQHRDEVERELRRAADLLGDIAFTDIDAQALTKLWRARIRQLLAGKHAAQRAAEITIQRLLAVAAWLRETGQIPAIACLAPKHWKERLAADWRAIAGEASNYQPHRPRYTVAEMRRIIEVATSEAAVAFDLDPRICLLTGLGAELRFGQVERMWRSDVLLEDGDHGSFTPPSTGKKRMPKVYMTPGQRAELDYALGERGYLRTLELRWKHDGQDYRMFPGRRLRDGQALFPEAQPLARSPIRRMYRAVEDLAGVPHVEGRGPYGLRRAGVDGAKAEGATREELKEGGGWTDTTMPDQVYADQEQDGARRGAARVRARVRGEK